LDSTTLSILSNFYFAAVCLFTKCLYGTGCVSLFTSFCRGRADSSMSSRDRYRRWWGAAGHPEHPDQPKPIPRIGSEGSGGSLCCSTVEVPDSCCSQHTYLPPWDHRVDYHFHWIYHWWSLQYHLLCHALQDQPKPQQPGGTE